MKMFLRVIVAIVIALFLVVLHLSIRASLSFFVGVPNVIFACLILMLLVNNSRSIVWIGFAAHFILELYTVAPYGINMLSATISLLFTYWIYQNFLANRSWYAAGVLTIISLAIYRLFYISFLVLNSLNSGRDFAVKSASVLFVWEAVATSLLVMAVYGFLTAIVPRLGAKDIRA